MTLLLIYLFLALLISFLCSIIEAVLLTTPISYLKVKEAEGKKQAKRMIAFKLHLDKPLSAILSLNTIAHTVGAAGVGAQATIVFGEAYFGLVSAILTILILVLTEILPKTIGARFSRELSLLSAQIITLMIYLVYPLVYASSIISKIISTNGKEQTTSREELSILAHIGVEEGIFDEKENKMIQNIIELKNRNIAEIMTPRVVAVVANEDTILKEYLANKNLFRFSRIPIFSEVDEHITGYVLKQDILEKIALGISNISLKDLKRELLFIPETSSLFFAWETLLEKKEHIAVAMDEYGGLAGIVTMEDIIETLIGHEIVDEKDTIPDMQQYARDMWKLKQEKYNLLSAQKQNQESK